MKILTLIIPASVVPFQAEGFPEGCHRMKGMEKSAIHIRPNTVIHTTESEYKHLVAAYPASMKSVIMHEPGRTHEEHMAARPKKEDAESVGTESAPSDGKRPHSKHSPR